MIWLICIFTLFLSSCEQKPQASHYKEVIIGAGQVNTPGVPASPPVTADQSTPADPHAGLDVSAMGLPSDDTSMNNMFTWQVPKGWKQEAGGGMRLATFHLVSDTKAIDCSIVALGGMAGGLEANLRRWMGQIGIQASEDQLNTLISSAPSTHIKSGQEGKIFDFTTIQSKAKPREKSLIAIMVSFNEATLFVKLAGSVETVKKNKADLLKLVGSIEPHMPPANPAAGVGMNPSADPHAGLDMAAMGGIIDAPTSQNILAWGLPEGWKEEAGKHMRMASFYLITDPKAFDCYIIALAGPAGGLEANLQRWLGQLGLQPSDQNVNQLIVTSQNLKTKDGLEAKTFDFTTLQTQGSPSDNSMLAAMIPLDKTTVFVKMTGSVGSVKQNKDNFLKLLESITRK